jgi:hypothetical protein
MIHNTHFAQHIPPNAMHIVTGTWTDADGTVTGQPCRRKTATAETAIISIPICIPSNSVALQGAKLASIEIDYDVNTAACTSVTAAISKIVRGADGAVSVVSAPACTQDLTAATDAADVDEHKLTVTLTTPVWIDNDEYYMLKLTVVAAATTVFDIFGAVANFTLKA